MPLLRREAPVAKRASLHWRNGFLARQTDLGATVAFCAYVAACLLVAAALILALA